MTRCILLAVTATIHHAVIANTITFIIRVNGVKIKRTIILKLVN
jgi:hypothetical protein